uniref:Uncharacterized protein n=1 Tax=Tanacetum cinerariifolium TaxID=118510 RepID=A0A699Q5S1_TANCI|nr:hypothetical protein [Tanacetum cinerariifolium]
MALRKLLSRPPRAALASRFLSCGAWLASLSSFLVILCKAKRCTKLSLGAVAALGAEAATAGATAAGATAASGVALAGCPATGAAATGATGAAVTVAEASLATGT